MLFEFTPTASFNFLDNFAAKHNFTVYGNQLVLPTSLGEGRIRYFNFEEEFKLLIHHYKLKEELTLKRIGTNDAKGLITFIFFCNDTAIHSTTSATNDFKISKNSDYAIQIASRDLNSLVHYPAEMEIDKTVIGISAERLKRMLQLKAPNSIVQSIFECSPGLLVHETMGIDVQKILKQLKKANEGGALNDFYWLIKTQELLYLVFEKLLKRETLHHNPLSNSDIEKLYLIRTAVLTDLSKPPSQIELSKMAGMSETKMKTLFKQVFGASIFNYFQEARMEEAACMLRHGDYSVSDVGYELGFSNLSHFGRVFEKHYGATPKKYSLKR